MSKKESKTEEEGSGNLLAVAIVVVQLVVQAIQIPTYKRQYDWIAKPLKLVQHLPQN